MHFEESAPMPGSVAQHEFEREGRFRDVVSKYVSQIDGLRGWGDRGRIQFLNLLDRGQDRRELLSHSFQFGGGQAKPGKRGHIIDLREC
jgi:hypothetical protein